MVLSVYHLKTENPITNGAENTHILMYSEHNKKTKIYIFVNNIKS